MLSDIGLNWRSRSLDQSPLSKFQARLWNMCFPVNCKYWMKIWVYESKWFHITSSSCWLLLVPVIHEDQENQTMMSLETLSAMTSLACSSGGLKTSAQCPYPRSLMVVFTLKTPTLFFRARCTKVAFTEVQSLVSVSRTSWLVKYSKIFTTGSETRPQ